MTNTKRLVLLALMISQALVLSIVESWIPIPIAIPGVKLGLANIVTLIVIIFFGFADAIAVTLIRTFLASVFGGGFVIFLFSVSGGILSTLVMGILYKRGSKVFSILGISIIGAIMHNIGQLLMASFVMRNFNVMTYLPILLVSGIIMGCFVGLCVQFLSKALKTVMK